MVIDQERTQFEAAMWAYYLDLKAKGWSAPGEGDPTPEALFWREESGKYGVLSVEAAWNGWQMARKSEVPAPAACAETLIFEDYPEFHAEGMGCGLEDRNITDRYEAMRYGWDEALEAVGLNITGFLSDLPQTAPVAQLSEPLTDEQMDSIYRDVWTTVPHGKRLFEFGRRVVALAAAPTTPKESS